MTGAPSQRLAVVLSHPNQYYSPWFRWLRAHTALEFRVFYLWDFGVTAARDPGFQAEIKWDVDLLSGYDSEFVPNTAKDPGMHHFLGLRNPDLPGRLAAWRPTAMLVFGYYSAGLLRAIFWARRRGIPLVFRGDSHFIGRPAPAWHRRLLLRLVYRMFSAVTYVGEANRAYFATLGVPDRKLHFAPHAVDPGLFDPRDSRHAAAAAALRATLGIGPDIRVVLFAGKLVPAKQPRELLEAFLNLALPGTALVFVGEGPEKQALLEAAQRADRSSPGTVYFMPFANQSEMPSRYLLADLFVLPSRGLYETWGLAVNEAMQMGVPCLVSDRVGCQRDLVIPGETGWVFRSTDAADLRRELSAALARLANAASREALKAAVAARIAGYSYARAAAGLLEALGGLPS